MMILEINWMGVEVGGSLKHAYTGRGISPFVMLDTKVANKLKSGFARVVKWRAI